MSNLDFSKIYSHSKIELFSKCRKQYHFNYLDPEVAPIKKQFIKPRDYKTKGSAVHGAITLFYYLPKDKRNFDGLKECLKKSWYSELDMYHQPPLSLLGGFKDIDHERQAYLDSLKLLKNFLNMEKEQSPSLFYVPVKTIKKSFEDYEKMVKPISKKISISGKFDRIDELEDGSLRVVDFKTGKSRNGMGQLEFYKLLTELNFDKKVNQVTYYYLNDGKVKDYDVSDVKVEDIKKKVLEKIKVIEEAKNFPPNPTRLCDHCDFKEICPVFKQD